ncbi:LysR substrate-binding domain-containing protein [Streptosporangium sp. NBC_01495]|nr:LysR substrate-binding domain-containing protein [Streptosporangium sp. NBC_01495]
MSDGHALRAAEGFGLRLVETAAPVGHQVVGDEQVGRGVLGALLEETVYLAALTGEPLEARRDAPWIAGTPGTLCHTMTVRACQATGYTPRVRHHADDFGTVLALVAAGQGVAFIPELGLLAPPPDVVLTALPTRRRTRLAYRRGTGGHPAVLAARSALHASVVGRKQ